MVELPGEKGEDFILNCFSRSLQGLNWLERTGSLWRSAWHACSRKSLGKAMSETAQAMHVCLASHTHSHLVGFVDTLGGFMGYTAKGRWLVSQEHWVLLPGYHGLLCDFKQGKSVCCNFPACVGFTCKCFIFWPNECGVQVLKQAANPHLVWVERDAVGGEWEMRSEISISIQHRLVNSFHIPH